MARFSDTPSTRNIGQIAIQSGVSVPEETDRIYRGDVKKDVQYIRFCYILGVPLEFVNHGTSSARFTNPGKRWWPYQDVGTNERHPEPRYGNVDHLDFRFATRANREVST